MNLTPGGLLGYCSSKCMARRNVPSSKGVSAGPMMTAFLRKTELLSESVQRKRIGEEDANHVMTLSATGDAETPAGGSVCMRCEERRTISITGE